MVTPASIPVSTITEGMTMPPAAYEQLALADPAHAWELHDGCVREKPGMSVVHNRTAIRLGAQLLRQIDESEFEVRVDAGRVRHEQETYYIPDVFIVPTRLVEAMLDAPNAWEIYDVPLPLVVEIWSPSTGNYDVDEKIPDYQRRGDLEIWRIQPYEQTVTVWRRQRDGTYRVETFHGGQVALMQVPGVVVDLDALFHRFAPSDRDGEDSRH